jgi:hypothetical protein
MPSTTLFADEYAVATLEADTGLLRYARTATPYPAIERMRAHYAELSRVLATIHPEKLGLLLDVRAAPPRNDEAFETEVAATVGVLFGRFRAHAFLVKTAVGNLQVRRLSATRGAPETHVFTEEVSALAFLSQRRSSPVDR